MFQRLGGGGSCYHYSLSFRKFWVVKLNALHFVNVSDQKHNPCPKKFTDSNRHLQTVNYISAWNGFTYILAGSTYCQEEKKRRESAFLHFLTLVCSFAGPPCVVRVTASRPAPRPCVLCAEREGVAPPRDLSFLLGGREAVCPSKSRGIADVRGRGVPGRGVPGSPAPASCKSLHITKPASKWDFLEVMLPIPFSPS